MQLNPYLIFNGRCEEALKFYEKVIGGKIEAIMPWGGSPAESQATPEWHNKILHAHFSFDGGDIMGTDGPPDGHEKPTGFYVVIHIKDVAKAESTFKALSEKGTVRMPPGKTFFAKFFGMLVDQFDIPWMIISE